MSSLNKITGLSREAQLALMGIEVWTERKTTALQLSETAAVSTSSDCGDQWSLLRSRVAGCQACGLAKGRTQTVFGVGNQKADILLVGEAPGFHEDRQGEPFVGRAGQLLTAMLAAIDLERKDVFIANILKCRPPNNRDPQPLEVATCTPYLLEQIQLIQPKLIVALGRIAAHFLLESTEPLTRLRGRKLEYKAAKRPLLVTYHPAYLLRNPRDKRKAWEDWQTIQSYRNAFSAKTLPEVCEQ
ncbi:MAG: polymerase [Gammaproteobacteria bacterium]|nr:polymerase [Gammaproteobacteria bacterium]